jgi:hypothetical protein
MLEINRALYLKEPGNEKLEGYLEVKRVVGEFVGSLYKLHGNH